MVTGYAGWARVEILIFICPWFLSWSRIEKILILVGFHLFSWRNGWRNFKGDLNIAKSLGWGFSTLPYRIIQWPIGNRCMLFLWWAHSFFHRFLQWRGCHLVCEIWRYNNWSNFDVIKNFLDEFRPICSNWDSLFLRWRSNVTTCLWTSTFPLFNYVSFLSVIHFPLWLLLLLTRFCKLNVDWLIGVIFIISMLLEATIFEFDALVI